MSEIGRRHPVSDPLPSHGRLAGIDYGTVRIGVAMTDPDRMLASPWETYQRRSPAEDAVYFKRIASEERVVGWVVGLPLHLDGNESGKSREVDRFAQWLRETTQVPVALQDERFSTAFAKEALAEANFSRRKTKARVDRIAAQILLTAYLESHRAQTGEHSGPLDPGSLDDRR